MITGFVQGQLLRLSAPVVAADTLDYLTAQFVFRSADWNGMEKWAHFAKDGAVYDIRLTEDKIRREDHLNLGAGEWKVYIHGNRFADGTVVERITTAEDVLRVVPTGALNGEPFPEMPASVAEQILARLEDVEQNGGGGVQVDDTLSKAGYAADAAAVGEKLNQQSNAIVNLNTTRINVRDFGAVGDGVTDDRQAIVDAFAAALNNLPCEVYFPAGTYGISNGITVNMEYGTGGLLVRGAGRDVTTIKYLEDGYNPDVTGYATMWYAIRIWPVGMPDINPTNEVDYLHDIGIEDITVYDPDPIAHAWSTCKGDPDGEETHGFDLQYVNRAAVTNCNIITVGDEAIDLCECIDAIVSGNHIVGSPAAGSSGGAISIGDGCRGVVVTGNTVNGSCEDEVLETQVTVAKGKKLSTKVILPDGTVYNKSTLLTADLVLPVGTILVKRNYGIMIESLYTPVSDVTISDNIISDIHGNGINLAVSNSGAEINRVVISGNIVRDCLTGMASSGSYDRNNIGVIGNDISDCSEYGINFDQNHTNTNISANTIVNVGTGMRLTGAVGTNVNNCFIKDVQGQAMFLSAENNRPTYVSNCNVEGAGLDGLNATGVIQAFSGTALYVKGCVLTNIQMTRGIHNATAVENTTIELANGGEALSGASLLRCTDCTVNGRINVKPSNAVVSGVKIESDDIGTNAITLSGSGTTVTGCVIKINNYSAIKENTGCDYNMIANNITNRNIATVGANTVNVNNITSAVI